MMKRLSTKMQSVMQQMKSRISPLIADDASRMVHLSIEVDPDLYALVKRKAELSRTTEQEIILQAITMHVQNRSASGPSRLSRHQKENNPLFLLDGFTHTIK